MQVYYENAEKTKTIHFDGEIYGIADLDVFRHEFRYRTEDDEIQEFTTGIQTYAIEANVSGTANKHWKKSYEEMIDIFDSDIKKKRHGTLYVNGSYMQCYFFASKLNEMFEDWGFQNVELKVVTDRNEWISETTFDFTPQTVEDEAENVKQYDYTYPYVYPKETVAQYINNDHYDTADFKMTIFGERSRVYITIGGNVYHVEYPIAAGEYMIIDSRSSAKTGERIYLVKSNGEKVNLFDYRDPDYSVFTKIPTGKSLIDIGGKGVTITLYKKRSEPKWS